MAKPDKARVRRFVETELKERLRNNRPILANRYKNLSTLKALGLTKKNALCVLSSLTTGDFHEGPLPDDKGRPQDIWVFGKVIAGRQVYIKLAVPHDKSLSMACISFHIAEHPMVNP